MMLPATSQLLYGRESELEAVGRLVGGLARGSGGALIVRGEAGIGKSALLGAAAAHAAEAGARVLSATGIEVEARFSYAGLHQILRPLLPLADRLAAQQRDALLSAFGMANSRPPGPYLVGLAALELISEAATSAPVFLIADDAQWLDEPSCAVLGFAARRTAAEPAAMLVAVRDGLAHSFGGAGLPELRLEALDRPAAAALLDERSPDLAPSLRERVLMEAAGNPLALVELPKSVRIGSEAMSRLPPSLLPLTVRLEEAFAAQESGLPESTRSLLLVAAANDGDAVYDLLVATSDLTGVTVGTDDLVPAMAAGLVESDETVFRFRHPLMRSAIYQAASTSERRAAHAALARLFVDRPDRQAWHQAASVLGPDEQVAADLEAAAVRALNRGAITMAVDAYQRAAQLSEDTPNRGRRLLTAAGSAFESGFVGRGGDLLRAAESLDLPPEMRTWAAWNREVFTESGWSGSAKMHSFVQIAEQMRLTGQTRAALDALSSIAIRSYWANPSQDFRSALIAAAEGLEVPESDPALLEILACADPLRCGSLVNARLEDIVPTEADPVGMFRAGYSAAAVWSWNRAQLLLKAAIDALRSQGRLGLLAQALMTQAWTALHLARPSSALSAADEAARLAEETGQAQWAIGARLAQALVAAIKGDVDTAEALAHEAETSYRAMGALPMLSLVQFVRGRSALLNQHYAEGFAHLRRPLDPGDPSYHPWVAALGLADLIEASVYLDQRDDALKYLARLEDLAAATDGPQLQAAATYARPLVARADNAEALFGAALEDGLGDWPEYRSRLLLRYGEWLRRQRRVTEARIFLREARDALDAIGVASLAERARTELRAAGEPSSRREPQPWDQLTPQELQIARMAADGMSNREIGEQLYISHRTVSAHLYRIFPKLDITSRSQLHAALA